MAKSKARKSTQQAIGFMPMLKKPMDAIGVKIKVPGVFWDGRMSATEKATEYIWCASPHSTAHHDTQYA